jgi:hypothetical protein
MMKKIDTPYRRQNKMENLRITLLDAVRLDAIAKLKKTDLGVKEQQNKVIDAAKNLMKLADLARKEGLLALEDIAQTIPSNFLKQLILLVVDGNFPEIIAEIGTNIYWTKAPDNADAMIDYMYLRGMLGIQNGDNPRVLEGVLMSLMPIELHQEYRTQMEVLHQKKDVEKLFSIHPTFQDSDICESIHNLEKMVSNLHNRCIQRVLRELDNKDLAICIYVLQQETRKRILDNLSTGLAHAIMEDVVLCASISEKDVDTSVTKTLNTINALLKTGEIVILNNV